MPFIGNQPALSYISLSKQDFTTSATTNYVLDQAVTNANEIALFINFVRQEPTTAYTASGTALTLTSATTAGDDMYCIFLGKALQTVTPASNSVTGDMLSKPFNYDSGTLYLDDTNNKVGIGTTSPDDVLAVNGGGVFITHNTPRVTFETTGAVKTNWRLTAQDTVDNGFEIQAGSADADASDDTFGALFRVLSNGGVHIGENNTNTNGYFRYENSLQDGNVARLHNQTTTRPYGLAITFDNASTDDNVRYAYFYNDSTASRFIVYSDGDVKNHDNSYGALSDERIKQDIRDSNSQWNDIKNIRVRNFKKKDDVRQYGENAWEQIGVIAQELEQVSPKLIKHSDPEPSDILSDASFGTLYQEGDEIPEGKKVGDVKEIHQQVKGVSYSVLYMKAIKALQEAMERIETLEAKVTALENA